MGCGGGGCLYDREILSDPDSPKPRDADQAVPPGVNDPVPAEADPAADDDSTLDDAATEYEVEHAWEVFKTRFLTRRTMYISIGFIIVVFAFLYGVLPQLPGLQESLETVRHNGDRTWLFVAFCMELLSYAAYIWFFRAVFIDQVPIIGWIGSYRISMAGVAATRLLGAAGAGGVALTFWAVRKAGMGRRESVSYLVAFYVILYGIFMFALLIDGILLRTGAVPGSAPFGVTVIPAAFGGLVILIFLLALAVPHNLERVASRWASGRGRVAAIAQKAVAVPALIGEGTRVALQLARRGDAGLLGALGWWAFDIATLWACFRAFGDAPPLAVLVMGYYVGMVANIIPTPGGIGAVEGGMIGSFIAFGVSAGNATAAVLAYRVFAFLMPTIPGMVAFVRLRRDVALWESEGATIQSKATPAGASDPPAA